MSGLTIITDRGTIEVPQEIEAQGGDAIQAYVDAQLVPATPPSSRRAPSPRAEPPTANPEE